MVQELIGLSTMRLCLRLKNFSLKFWSKKTTYKNTEKNQFSKLPGFKTLCRNWGFWDFPEISKDFWDFWKWGIESIM
jgi:hypothetical protein